MSDIPGAAFTFGPPSPGMDEESLCDAEGGRLRPGFLASASHVRQYAVMNASFIRFFLAAAILASTIVPVTPSVASRSSIYPKPAQAQNDLAEGLKAAAAGHRRVLIVFGADWCADCIVLDQYFHQEPNRSLLQSHYVVVHVNIGDGDQNLELAARYGVPLYKGVPALAVLSDSGELIFRQRQGEFEGMRRMSPDAVTAFLTRWKNPAD
jgi:thioredoxin 1